MPMENFHSCRLVDPSEFTEFRYKKQGGADVVLGKKKDGKWAVQAIRYPKESFTEAEARSSCGRHGGHFEPAKHSDQTENTWYGLPLLPWEEQDEPDVLKNFSIALHKEYAKNLFGVDIFAAGTWNGDTYTEKDLDAMVDAFNKVGIKVPLKLGHSETQRWFGQEDGAPALGWVSRIYRIGKKLFADFMNVPDVIIDLIKNGNYSGKSAEIYWNFKDKNSKVWPRVLRAVSLLGAELPAVSVLDDLKLALANNQTPAVSYTEDKTSFVVYSYDGRYEECGGESDMDEEKEKKYKEEIESLKMNLASMEQRAITAEAKLAERDEAFAMEKFCSRLDGLIKEGKVLPSEKNGLVRTFALLGPGTKKYADKEVNPREELLNDLEKRPKIVQFSEKGRGGEIGDFSSASGETPAQKVDSAVRKIMAERKKNYVDALDIVKIEYGDLWKEYLSSNKEDA